MRTSERLRHALAVALLATAGAASALPAGVPWTTLPAADRERLTARAARLQANYDDLERRIAELAAKEDLERVRPDIDGNEIMKILGIPPGPEVGKAWNHLKELRLDRGPLDHDQAVEELLRWWNEQGGPRV